MMEVDDPTQVTVPGSRWPILFKPTAATPTTNIHGPRSASSQVFKKPVILGSAASTSTSRRKPKVTYRSPDTTAPLTLQITNPPHPSSSSATTNASHTSSTKSVSTNSSFISVTASSNGTTPTSHLRSAFFTPSPPVPSFRPRPSLPSYHPLSPGQLLLAAAARADALAAARRREFALVHGHGPSANAANALDAHSGLGGSSSSSTANGNATNGGVNVAEVSIEETEGRRSSSRTRRPAAKVREGANIASAPDAVFEAAIGLGIDTTSAINSNTGANGDDAAEVVSATNGSGGTKSPTTGKRRRGGGAGGNGGGNGSKKRKRNDNSAAAANAANERESAYPTRDRRPRERRGAAAAAAAALAANEDGADEGEGEGERGDDAAQSVGDSMEIDVNATTAANSPVDEKATANDEVGGSNDVAPEVDEPAPPTVSKKSKSARPKRQARQRKSRASTKEKAPRSTDGDGDADMEVGVTPATRSSSKETEGGEQQAKASGDREKSAEVTDGKKKAGDGDAQGGEKQIVEVESKEESSIATRLRRRGSSASAGATSERSNSSASVSIAGNLSKSKSIKRGASQDAETTKPPVITRAGDDTRMDTREADEHIATMTEVNTTSEIDVAIDPALKSNTESGNVVTGAAGPTSAEAAKPSTLDPVLEIQISKLKRAIEDYKDPRLRKPVEEWTLADVQIAKLEDTEDRRVEEIAEEKSGNGPSAPQ